MKGKPMNTENISNVELEAPVAENISAEALPQAKPENYSHKISVIMPVYNADDYIAQAIETVLSQTLEDFELICVDDGSTDKSVEIIKSFAKKDDRVKLFEMSHVGVSTA